MAKKKKTEEGEVSFEQAFEELQEIVAKMEAGDLSLGDSLSSYEVGIKRLKQCHKALNAAEQKIRQLAKLDEDGNLDTTEFDEDSGTGANGDAKSGRGKKSDSDELF